MIEFISNKGKMEIVKLLIEKGADVNTKDCDGDTSLHYAIYGGN